MNDTANKRSLSISIRLPLLFIASFLLIIVSVVILVFVRFERRTVEEYTAMGKSATMLMAQEFDPEKTQLYIEQNFQMKEYVDIRKQLMILKENYPDVMYMYIYHFIPEGGEVIFDLDSDYSLDADPPGTIYEPDPAVIPYMDALCAGEQIPVLTGDTDDGYMLTYMRPVFDSQGQYRCHVCVDFSMETLHREDLMFVLNLLIVLIAAMALIILIDIFIMRRTITGPINRMKQATDSFSYENESDRQKNISIMEKLNIRTGDEIEDIYRLFITFMKNNLRFVQTLNKAENDIKTKDAQIGQISQEAYRDTLTGVGSKAAYMRKAAELGRVIADGNCAFAIVMIDLNNLKQINDVFGHEAGDSYIKGSCHIICEVYKHSPVFRIGGDEFVVILQGQDYESRDQLLKALRTEYAECFAKKELDPWLRYTASAGMATASAEDLAEAEHAFELVFKRADQEMYAEKNSFKALHGSYR